MANVVVVADMLRGFCEEGRNLYVGPSIRGILPRIQALLREEKAKGSRAIFLADTHDPDDREFEMFPRHCVRGSEETEIIPELRELADEVIPKRRYSGFFETSLDRRLRDLAPDKIIVVGVCTNICVQYTVADARSRDFQVEVPADCVTSFDQDAHEHSLGQIEKVLGAKVTGVPVD